jgi:hypothetical protein
MKLTGSCHCGNLEVELETAIEPEQTGVRACQCSFCGRHAARTISDPAGKLRITVADPDKLCRYRFGLQTSEAWVCARCGVYVAAILDEPPRVATLNARVLTAWDRFTGEPTAVDYSGETAVERIARRRRGWTPTTLVMPEPSATARSR